MKQKDWIATLADAIQDEYGVDTSRKSARAGLVKLIAKHCPFEPDAAYMKVVPQKPGHVWDWAAQAGVYLHAEGVRLSSHRIAAVVAHFAEPLVRLLKESRRAHDESYLDEKNDYPPCPKSYEDADEDSACTCGADEWNKRVDAVLGEESE